MSDEAHPENAADKPASKKRSTKPSLARGNLPLPLFRGLLEILQSHRDTLSEDQVRALEKLLHAFANDADGTVKFALTPSGHSEPKRPRFSNAATVETGMPGDDDIRGQTREIALIDDDAERHRRIETLGERFLRRASAIYAFKADTLAGLRSGFAAAVADVRQMEQIAASGQRKLQTEDEPQQREADLNSRKEDQENPPPA